MVSLARLAQRTRTLTNTTVRDRIIFLSNLRVRTYGRTFDSECKQIAKELLPDRKEIHDFPALCTLTLEVLRWSKEGDPIAGDLAKESLLQTVVSRCEAATAAGDAELVVEVFNAFVDFREQTWASRLFPAACSLVATALSSGSTGDTPLRLHRKDRLGKQVTTNLKLNSFLLKVSRLQAASRFSLRHPQLAKTIVEADLSKVGMTLRLIHCLNLLLLTDNAEVTKQILSRIRVDATLASNHQNQELAVEEGLTVRTKNPHDLEATDDMPWTREIGYLIYMVLKRPPHVVGPLLLRIATPLVYYLEHPEVEETSKNEEPSANEAHDSSRRPKKAVLDEETVVALLVSIAACSAMWSLCSSSDAEQLHRLLRAVIGRAIKPDVVENPYRRRQVAISLVRLLSLFSHVEGIGTAEHWKSTAELLESLGSETNTKPTRIGGKRCVRLLFSLATAVNKKSITVEQLNLVPRFVRFDPELIREDAIGIRRDCAKALLSFRGVSEAIVQAALPFAVGPNGSLDLSSETLTPFERYRREELIHLILQLAAPFGVSMKGTVIRMVRCLETAPRIHSVQFIPSYVSNIVAVEGSFVPRRLYFTWIDSFRMALDEVVNFVGTLEVAPPSAEEEQDLADDDEEDAVDDNETSTTAAAADEGPAAVDDAEDHLPAEDSSELDTEHAPPPVEEEGISVPARTPGKLVSALSESEKKILKLHRRAGNVLARDFGTLFNSILVCKVRGRRKLLIAAMRYLKAYYKVIADQYNSPDEPYYGDRLSLYTAVRSYCFFTEAIAKSSPRYANVIIYYIFQMADDKANVKFSPEDIRYLIRSCHRLTLHCYGGGKASTSTGRKVVTPVFRVLPLLRVAVRILYNRVDEDLSQLKELPDARDVYLRWCEDVLSSIASLVQGYQAFDPSLVQLLRRYLRMTRDEEKISIPSVGKLENEEEERKRRRSKSRVFCTIKMAKMLSSIEEFEEVEVLHDRLMSFIRQVEAQRAEPEKDTLVLKFTPAQIHTLFEALGVGVNSCATRDMWQRDNAPFSL